MWDPVQSSLLLLQAGLVFAGIIALALKKKRVELLRPGWALSACTAITGTALGSFVGDNRGVDLFMLVFFGVALPTLAAGAVVVFMPRTGWVIGAAIVKRRDCPAPIRSPQTRPHSAVPESYPDALANDQAAR